MSQTIKLPNYSSNNLKEVTRIDADITAAATTFTVQNTQGLEVGNFVIVGTPGGETTEMITVKTVVSNTSIEALAALKFNHSRYDQVSVLNGNKLNIYRSANVNGLQPADSTYTLIDTIDIDTDQAYTNYNDTTGSSNYWYKYTFYNSTTTAETNLADSKSARGGGTGDYCSLDLIRNEAGFRNAKYITDEMIDVKRQAAQREIDGTLNGFYVVPFIAPINERIADICVRLAAGLLLTAQYGAINSISNASGKAKTDEARADLQKLVRKEEVLTNAAGVSQVGDGGTGGVSSWPNDNTASNDISTMAEGQDGGHVFRMSDNLGYYGRKF